MLFAVGTARRRKASRSVRATFLVLALQALVSACGGAPEVVEVRFSQGTTTRLAIRAEVADSEGERARGLMGRTALPEDRGMLFLWDEAAVRGFWMKGTLIALDLAAVRDGRVVGIYSLRPCRADPCPVTRTDPADSAVELAAGVLAGKGIGVGFKIDIVRLKNL